MIRCTGIPAFAIRANGQSTDVCNTYARFSGSILSNLSLGFADVLCVLDVTARILAQVLARSLCHYILCKQASETSL